LRSLLIGVTLLAMLSATVTWVVQDRQRLIRERDEARQNEADAKRRLDVTGQELHRAILQLSALKRQSEAQANSTTVK
jgi:hypothetical protein